jgi:uncharacterized membrane protein
MAARVTARAGAVPERLRASLFFVPLLFVVAGGLAGGVMIAIDQAVGDDVTDLPLVLTSTADSARQVLSVVAQATMTIAGIAFSISLLIIQLASSEYSPRVVHSLFRDPFNKRVMGIVLATFTYCLVVLRVVRDETDGGAEAIVPHLSVSLAVVAGVIAVLAVVAFIDHNAHAMEVSEILGRVTAETVRSIEESWVGTPGPVQDTRPTTAPEQPGLRIPLDESGWIQRIDHDALRELVPGGGTVRLEVAPGRYAIAGAPLCTVWPAPSDPDDATRRAADAVRVGTTRTMEQDASYGIRQLADVALKALSSGVNDPTTAQDAIFHMTGVLRELMVRPSPPLVRVDDEGRRVIHASGDTEDADLVALAYDEVRRAAAGMPAVCLYLLQSLHLLCQALEEAGQVERADPLRAQADLVLAGVESADGVLEADRAEVRRAHEAKFG